MSDPSESDEDPVVSVALRKRRRASAIAAVLHARGDPVDDEASGEDGEGEASSESGDDDVGTEGAHPPERVAQMRRVVESIELCVRNVGLSPDYVALAEPALAKLQATCKVYANQAISNRWSAPFVSVLKRSRMIRVQTIPHAWKGVLRQYAGRCQVCGAAEHRCDQVFELVGVAPTERAPRPLGAVRLGDMAEAYNDYDDADEAIGAGRHGVDEYLGMYSCGQTCFEKVVTAFLAHNFVMDIAYEVRRRIDVALALDPALLARWECDERDPKAVIEPVTTRDTALAEQLLTKLQRIEAALRGASLGALLPRQTGNAGTWERVDATLLRWSGVDENITEEEGREDVLRTCARQAQRALVAFGYEESEPGSDEDESADDSNAEELADDEVVVLDDESDADHDDGHHEDEDERDAVPHPPPPPPSPVRRDFVSARTRGALARLGQRVTRSRASSAVGGGWGGSLKG